MEKPLILREGEAGPNPVRFTKYARVGEWSKPKVCKTLIRWFESSHVLKKNYNTEKFGTVFVIKKMLLFEIREKGGNAGSSPAGGAELVTKR